MIRKTITIESETLTCGCCGRVFRDAEDIGAYVITVPCKLHGKEDGTIASVYCDVGCMSVQTNETWNEPDSELFRTMARETTLRRRARAKVVAHRLRKHQN